MGRDEVERWIEGYVELWRTEGTGGLAALFARDASYLPSPWATPVVGLAAIEVFWDAEREGPDEVFTFTHEIVAVDDDTAVVRVAVDYGDPVEDRWKDLWLIRMAEDGRCAAFEEWPFAPSQPDGHD